MFFVLFVAIFPIRAYPWIKNPFGLALEKIAKFVKILCAFVPLCLLIPISPPWALLHPLCFLCLLWLISLSSSVASVASVVYFPCLFIPNS